MVIEALGWMIRKRILFLTSLAALYSFGWRNRPVSVRLASDVSPTVPCVTVIAFNRPHALRRLLLQLNLLDFESDTGHVRVTITIDKPQNGVDDRREETASIASAWEFSHGHKVVDLASSHRGMVYQWVNASWTPDLDADDERPACLILEDDLVPSRFAWRWMRRAMSEYSQQTAAAPSLWPRVASLALQRPTLITISPPNHGVMPPRTGDRPFLYRLVASWGFVALRDQWISFRAFMRVRFVPTHFKNILFNGQEIKPSRWHHGSGAARMWTYWFLLFMDERNLFTFYANLNMKATLCTNMRDEGVHYGSSVGADFPTLESEVPALFRFPDLGELTWHNWDANAMDVGSLWWKRDCDVAVTTVATNFTSEFRGFLRSVRHFHKFVPIYIAGNDAVRRAVAVEFADSGIRVDTTLEHYGQGAPENYSKFEFTNFQMEKTRVLRTALNDGCRGAWFLNGGPKFALPDMTGVNVGLLPNHPDADRPFDAGSVYMSGYEPLDLWEVSIQLAKSSCCQAEEALDTVSQKLKWTDLGKLFTPMHSR